MAVDDNTPLVEAELVKGLLESAGIEAALKDDNLGSLAPSMSVNIGLGGMRVIVAPEDYEVAIQLVESRENKK
jgi:hypothetical protein